MAFAERKDSNSSPEQKRADALQFIHELTGIPARSIGSQIAVLPASPLQSSPLASVGQPPVPVSDALSDTVLASVGVVDVLPGVVAEELVSMVEPLPDTADDPVAEIEPLQLEPTPEPEPLEPPTPDLPAVDPPVTEPAVTAAPPVAPPAPPVPSQSSPSPAAPTAPPPTAFVRPSQPAATQTPPPTPTPSVAPPAALTAMDSFGVETASFIEPTPDDLAPPEVLPDTPALDITADPPDEPSVFSGPIDPEVVAAGGNPMMSRRTDLTQEQKLDIARRSTERREDRREERQEARDQRDAKIEPLAPPPPPAPPTQPEVVFATSLFTDDPVSEEPPLAETADPPPAAGDPPPQPQNEFASSPLTPEMIAMIRDQVLSQMRQRRGGKDQSGAIDVPPATSTVNPQIPTEIPGEFEAEPTSQIDTAREERYTQAFAAADDFIDIHDEVISMIIEALSRLTAGYMAHRSRLTTILDRLDSEADFDETGEGGTTWLG